MLEDRGTEGEATLDLATENKQKRTPCYNIKPYKHADNNKLDNNRKYTDDVLLICNYKLIHELFFLFFLFCLSVCFSNKNLYQEFYYMEKICCA